MAQVGIMGNIQEVYGSQVYANWFALGPEARNLKTWWDYEDFFLGVDQCNWADLVNGAGASITDSVFETGRIGLLSLATGTTAAGYATLFRGSGTVSHLLFGEGEHTFETEIKLAALSTIAEEFIIRMGYGDSIVGADHTDGAYFEYDRLTNVNWLACTASNGVRTKTDTGIAASINWTKFKIVVNAAGTAVQFYINGTLIATNTLNIPTAAGRWFTNLYNIVKSAGLTTRLFYIDWAWLHYDLTASR